MSTFQTTSEGATQQRAAPRRIAGWVAAASRTRPNERPHPGGFERSNAARSRQKPHCYAIGLAIAGAGLWLSFMLEDRLAPTPTPLLFAAVMLATWQGGLGPGLAATAVSAVGLFFLISEPVGLGDESANQASLLHLGVFVFVALLVSTLQEQRRIAEAKARSEAQRLAVVAEVARAFVDIERDLQATLKAMAQRIAEALGDSCVISLVSEDGQWLPTGWHHRDPDALAMMSDTFRDVQHRANEGLTGRMIAEGRSLFLPVTTPANIAAVSKPDYLRYLEAFPVYSVMSVPLCARGSVIGALTVTRSTPGVPYTEEDHQLVQQLADRAGLAIENARLVVYHRTLFENIPAPTVVTDAQRRILDANPAASRLLDHPREKLQGHRLDEIVTVERGIEHNADEVARPVGRETGGPGQRNATWDGMLPSPRQGELLLHRRDGSTVPVATSTAQMHLPTGMVEVDTWHDLTAQRALQSMRDSFAASASHELRTPLTAIHAALRLLEDTGDNTSEADRHELLANARRNVQRLRFLVDDLLTQSQLQAGQLRVERQLLDVRTVIAGAIEAVHPLTVRRQQSIEVHIPVPLMIDADPKRLEQVLVNLLANANTYTPRGATIWIEGRPEPDNVRLTIRDNGPGIPAAEIETVFERFSRAATAPGGTGLGLAIARDLVELHGGRIWAETAPGGGAVFHIALPRGIDAHAPSNVPNASCVHPTTEGVR